MRHFALAAWLSLGMAAVLTMVGQCRLAAALDIVKDGKPAATIVLPDKADATVREAAKQIVENIRLCTGATLPTVPEAQAPAEGTLISIGKTAAAEKLNLDLDKQLADTCFLRVQGRTLFLAGRDIAPARGTLCAAFALLSDYAGVRWIMPGPCGVWNPKSRNIAVPDDLDRKVEPALLYIHPRLDRYYPWSLANGARTAVQMVGGGEKWGIAVPPAKYAKDHPEYYALRDGKRKADPKDNNPSLCTSNPEVVNLLTAWVRSKFDEGCDIVELGECDSFGGQACQCAECNKRFGDASTAKGLALRVFLPHLEVVNRCLKSHPDKFVMVMVYSEAGRYLNDIAAGRAPDPGIKFPSSAIANVTCPSWRSINRMRRVFPRVTNYVYWWSPFYAGLSPNQSPLSVSQFMRMLVDLKSLGIYFDGGAENWPGEAPNLYVALRSAQDRPEDLMKEFCTGLYGKASGVMSQYYKLLYARVRTMIDTNVCDCIPDWGYFPDVPADHCLGEKYVTFWPEASLKKMAALLNKAEQQAAGDERALNWIRLARVGYDQVNVTAAVYHAERAYEANKSAETLRAIKARMDAFNQFVQRINDLPKTEPKFVQDYFPNHADFVGLLNKNEGFCAGRGAPFTWDLDKRMGDIAKPQDEKILHVKRTTAKPGPDGALDPNAWADAKPVVLLPYRVPDGTVDKDKETTACALYDDERLYVRFECREPNLDNLKLASVGRDGDVYHLDEVELFLDPERSDSKFMHLMAAPVKDAAYDERMGYVEDIADPMYNRADISWNADWTYACKIDKEHKLWTLEMAITFKSLGVSAPKSGAAWTANFARARRAGGEEELSSWIAEVFSDPALFGKIVFEGEAEK